MKKKGIFKRAMRSLWSWIKFIFTFGYCGRKKRRYERVDEHGITIIEEGKIKEIKKFTETVETVTPRRVKGEDDTSFLDDFLLKPEVRAAIEAEVKQRNALKNARQVLVRKSQSAPPELETLPEVKNEANVLEKEREENNQSDI